MVKLRKTGLSWRNVAAKVSTATGVTVSHETARRLVGGGGPARGGAPRRRLYRLTGIGQRRARETLAGLQLGAGAAAWAASRAAWDTIRAARGSGGAARPRGQQQRLGWGARSRRFYATPARSRRRPRARSGDSASARQARRARPGASWPASPLRACAAERAGLCDRAPTEKRQTHVRIGISSGVIETSDFDQSRRLTRQHKHLNLLQFIYFLPWPSSTARAVRRPHASSDFGF
jgi:hypothetical protein